MDQKTLQLDTLDKQLVSILSANCRKSSREISKETKVSHQTIISRLKKLEENGIIEGYSALVNLKKLGYKHKMLFLAETGKMDNKQMGAITKFIRKDKSFTEASVTNGEYDLYFVGHFRSRAEAYEKTMRLRSFLSKELDLRSFRNFYVWDTLKFNHSIEP